MNKREARRIARHRAALILESAIHAGWHPDDLVDQHGDDAVDDLAEEIMGIARRLSPDTYGD